MRTTRLLAASVATIFAFGLLAGCPKEEKKEECGNGILEGLEECDTNTFYLEDTCEAEGFFGGTLTCTSACTISTATCHNCGDGIMDAGEDCDGTDFGTNTCDLEGFDDGALACNNDCSINTSGCFDNECVATSFTSVEASAITDNSEWYYEEIVTANSLSYVFVVDLYDDGGQLVTGDYTLGVGDEATMGSCLHCVYLYECTDSACSELSTFFFATAGTLSLDTLGQAGGTFAGGVDDVVFTEWDYDYQNEIDEPVTDGECLDVSAWSFSFTPVGYHEWPN